MNRWGCRIANQLLALACRREAVAFHRGLDDVAATQQQLLRETLAANRTCTFGREHDFAALATAEDYRQAVPLRDYADFVPAIERIRRGETQVLTAEPVRLLEPTGGSSGGSKLIPYTAGLQRQFQRGLAPWFAGLFRHQPGLLNGASYWSATPVARLDRSGAIPIGFDDDSNYAGRLGRHLVRSTQAVPERLKRVEAMDSFWYLTLLFLLRRRDLALISIWNPTFLTILDRHRQIWWPQLADDIAAGTLSPPSPVPAELVPGLKRLNRPDPLRATEIRQACILPAADGYRSLWPQLQLISCWADAAAAAPAEQLKQLFPGVNLQGKGLLATEGFFTLPLHGIDGGVPAYRSHFFEFLADDGGASRLLHELDTGQTYTLAVTTAGGLYRYRMHDRVCVVGRLRGLPLLRFIGRAGPVTDHFGEKLHEGHVAAALQQATDEQGLQPTFHMLAFEAQPEPGYVLFVEEPRGRDEELLAIAARLDGLLQTNFHYRYCRGLGQLAAIRVFRIIADGAERYLNACCEDGQRAGDVKVSTLDPRTGWVARFAGMWLPRKPNSPNSRTLVPQGGEVPLQGVCS